MGKGVTDADRDEAEHDLQPHRQQSRLLAALYLKYQAKTKMTSFE
jgi:hypothetical protein